MMKLRKILLSHSSESKIDSSPIEEPPELEKDKQLVMMKGPLSTIFALTLMKKYSNDADNIDPTIEQKETNDNQPNPDEQKPASLAVEAQMAYIDQITEKIDQDTKTSEEEISNGIDRYNRYFQSTVSNDFTKLE